MIKNYTTNFALVKSIEKYKKGEHELERALTGMARHLMFMYKFHKKSEEEVEEHITYLVTRAMAKHIHNFDKSKGTGRPFGYLSECMKRDTARVINKNK